MNSERWEHIIEEAGGVIVILLVLVMFLYIDINDHLKYLHRISSYNGLARAVITDMEEGRPTDEIHTIAIYEYTVSEADYTQREKISVGLNPRLLTKAGDSLTVRYNTNNPQQSTAIQSEDFYPSHIVAGGLIVFLIGVVVNKVKKVFQI